MNFENNKKLRDFVENCLKTEFKYLDQPDYYHKEKSGYILEIENVGHCSLDMRCIVFDNRKDIEIALIYSMDYECEADEQGMNVDEFRDDLKHSHAFMNQYFLNNVKKFELELP